MGHRLPTFLVLACALVPMLAGCGRDARLERARDHVARYFEREVTTVDPGWANLFGYLHRRFGLELRNASGAALHEVPVVQERAEIAAVFRRLVDPGASVPKQAIADLDTPVDRMTASALHCDRIPLPEGWRDVLGQATGIGGYALTHAALAGQWTVENGCRSAIELAALQQRQVDALAALVDGRDARVAKIRNSIDLRIEAIVMLYYLGARDRVDPIWIDHVLEAQNEDGGWPLGPTAVASDPHASALALWVLLENLQPDAPAITWIPKIAP